MTGTRLRVMWYKSSKVPEERTVSIFRAEEWDVQASSRLLIRLLLCYVNANLTCLLLHTRGSVDGSRGDILITGC
jgi:hypothetical protein